MQPFDVRQEIVDRSVQMLSESWRQLTDEQRLMTMCELGNTFYDQTFYNADGDLEFTGTDLQVVAAAAAFFAVAKSGAYLK